jgi:MFS family permease
MNKERLWTKDFICVFVMNFLLALIFYLLMATIAPYAIDKFHSSTSVAGLISGIFIIGSLIGRLVTGRIIEDIGSRKMLVISIILNFIASTFYFFAYNLQLLLINRVLHGFVSGIWSTAAATLIAQIIPDKRRGEGIGYYSMSIILGTASGPFVGILLSQHANYNSIFIFNLVLLAISFILSHIVKGPVHKSFRPVQVKAERRFHISNFIELNVMPISIVSLIIAFSYSGILTFLSFYSKQIHLVEAASYFFLVYAITVLISRPFSGRLLDQKGANTVIYPCLCIYAIGMLLFSQASHGITLLLSGAIIGLGYGNYQSSAQAIAIKAVPSHRLGVATSTFMIFYDLGFGVGPYLFGLLIPFTGCRGLYSMMVIVIFAAIVLYYFLHGRKISKA